MAEQDPSRSGAAAPDWLIRHEVWLVWATSAALLALIPVALGHIGLSWDALNHQIYLGWIATHPRLDVDFMPASYQSYQYPYLYWPLQALALGGASGVQAGVTLAQLHSLAVPAVWMIARACIPGATWPALTMRAMAVVLAFLNGVVLSMFDATANDLLASVPLVWAVALAISPLEAADPLALRRAARNSGWLAGMAIAFKLSNAPIAIVLPLLWLWGQDGLAPKCRRLLLGAAFAGAGYLLAYGYWGWQMWVHFGNPIFPLYDGWFEGVRQLTGWQK